MQHSTRPTYWKQSRWAETFFRYCFRASQNSPSFFWETTISWRISSKDWSKSERDDRVRFVVQPVLCLFLYGEAALMLGSFSLFSLKRTWQQGLGWQSCTQTNTDETKVEMLGHKHTEPTVSTGVERWGFGLAATGAGRELFCRPEYSRVKCELIRLTAETGPRLGDGAGR